MDQDQLIDRFSLRRKLRWWRVATIATVFLAIIAISLTQEDNLITSDHIARVEIFGVIQDDDELISRLEQIEDDDQVKALVLTISSPGGTTFGGERLYKAIKSVGAKKPVVAEIRTLAASAGYMIASAADHVIAGDTSIVGSIGVIFQYPQVGKLLEDIGVSMEEIKSSPLKAEPSPFHAASEEAVAMINATVMDSYDWFVGIVAQNRNLSQSDTLKLADGSIFTGRQSLGNGLVDAIGGEDEIRVFLETKDISEDLDIQLWPARNLEPSGLFFGIVGTMVQKYFSFEGTIAPAILSDRKLFLDGLVSFWHFGPDKAQ